METRGHPSWRRLIASCSGAGATKAGAEYLAGRILHDSSLTPLLFIIAPRFVLPGKWSRFLSTSCSDDRRFKFKEPPRRNGLPDSPSV